MVAWSQLESEALYLGLGEFGNDFDAIKAKYQNELANRSVRSCHRKVARDDRRYAKRQVKLQELLQEQVGLYTAAQNYAAVQQIQNLQQGLAEGFAQLAVANQEEAVSQEVNVTFQSLTNLLKGIQTRLLTKFKEFKPYVVEIEEGLDDDSIDMEQPNENAGLDVLTDKLTKGCEKFEEAVAFKINILLAAFKSRFP